MQCMCRILVQCMYAPIKVNRFNYTNLIITIEKLANEQDLRVDLSAI